MWRPACGPGETDDKFAHLPEWTGWELVRGYRERAGLTQDQLTDRTGLSHNYYTAIERGQQTNPSVRVVLAISKGLALPPAAFFE
jgi:transcriptional regulator with XRE-family HTH domain